MKPLQKDCKRYCDDYAQCNKSVCMRKKGWKNNGDITMLSVVDSMKATYQMKWSLYNEDLSKQGLN